MAIINQLSCVPWQLPELLKFLPNKNVIQKKKLLKENIESSRILYLKK
jgi:hypothetical protein